MLDEAIHTLAHAQGAPGITARIRRSPEDFQVTEVPLLEPAGSGEHVWICVRKRTANTADIASRLAKLAGVHPRQVGFAGLKDRHAVTEQWFSVHLPGRDAPDWHRLDGEDVTVLRHARHARKLQRGALRGNTFRITLRAIPADHDELERRLQRVRADGVPNYFGEQRFGRDGSNLQTAARLFANPSLRLSRNARGLALSAARALLFNRVLSARVAAGNWDRPVAGDALQLDGSHSFFVASVIDEELRARARAHDIHPTGPLCGRGEVPVTDECLALESRVLAGYQSLTEGLMSAGVRYGRRALRVIPGELAWHWQGEDTLELDFGLPAGSYATVVLRELVEYRG